MNLQEAIPVIERARQTPQVKYNRLEHLAAVNCLLDYAKRAAKSAYDSRAFIGYSSAAKAEAEEAWNISEEGREAGLLD